MTSFLASNRSWLLLNKKGIGRISGTHKIKKKSVGGPSLENVRHQGIYGRANKQKAPLLSSLLYKTPRPLIILLLSIGVLRDYHNCAENLVGGEICWNHTYNDMARHPPKKLLLKFWIPSTSFCSDPWQHLGLSILLNIPLLPTLHWKPSPVFRLLNLWLLSPVS